MKVLLMGMPNVGKSVIFSKLTGVNVEIANYAGTTVEYVAGSIKTSIGAVTLVDVPGTYTLDATNEAEKVAVDMLSSKPDAVVCVLDANNIESSLFLLLQILEKHLPVAVVLNRVDIADDNNVKIDLKKLRTLLNINIIPMVAVKSVGIEELKGHIEDVLQHKKFYEGHDFKADWHNAEKIAKEVVCKGAVRSDCKNGRRKRRIEQLIVNPFPGIFIAGALLVVVFGIVVGLGMSIRQFMLLPFFRGIVFPQIIYLVEMIVAEGFFRNVLIGEYGFLIKGIEWPITLVLPYVFSFYLALSLLEDSGYLPRLGILLDGIFNKIGLSGSNIIPIILGYGCTIPAITSTRAMNSKKERLIVVSMVALSVPCISQTGVFISMLAERSVVMVMLLFLLSFIAAAVGGFVANKFLGGSAKPITLVEVPVLLVPDFSILGKKILVRIKSYLKDGAVMMFYAIFATAILFEIGFFQILGRFMAPVVENWLMLPRDASIPLVLGIIRRELSVLPLLEMNLTNLQLFVGAVVGLFYVPCIAVIAMIAKEFGLKWAVGIFLITMGVAFLLGGLIAQIGFLLI